MFRRFGYLQARLLLEKQTRLNTLEQQLYFRDRSDEEDGCSRLYSLEYSDETGSKPEELMHEIKKSLCEYGQ